MALFKSVKFYLILAGVLAIIGVLWQVNNWRVDAGKVPGLEAQLKTAGTELENQKKSCEAAKTTTQEVTKNYENLLAQRDADIAELRKRPATCVPIYISRSASGGDAAHQPNLAGEGNGVSSSFLIDFAGSCETDRIKVITLQDYINRILQDYKNFIKNK